MTPEDDGRRELAGVVQPRPCSWGFYGAARGPSAPSLGRFWESSGRPTQRGEPIKEPFLQVVIGFAPQAGMAELVDARDSKSRVRKGVRVRPPLPALSARQEPLPEEPPGSDLSVS